MNKENLKTLIATIKAAGERGDFHINRYAHDCGSPACIAGYAAHLQGLKIGSFKWDEYLTYMGNIEARLRPSDLYKEALAKYLGVSFHEASEIAGGYWVALDAEVSPDDQMGTEEATQFLEAMLEQGRPLTWTDVFCEAER